MAHIVIVFGSLIFMNHQIGMHYSDQVYTPAHKVEINDLNTYQSDSQNIGN